MSTLKKSFLGVILALCLFVLTGCRVVEQVKSAILPTQTPLPTATPQPFLGEVDLRTAYNGWAVTVANVVRSSLNPTLNIPMATIKDDEFDYISMDVTIERTIDSRGALYGDGFVVTDADGKVFPRDGTIHNWLWSGDMYYGTPLTDRIAFRVPKTAEDFVLRVSPWPEVPQPLEVALNKITAPRQVDLMQAIEMGLLTANVRGVSLESIEVEVSLKVDDQIELSILPGTTFLAPSPDLQTMVVRSEVFVFLEEKDEASLEVSVACANMRLKAPTGGEDYIVKIEPPAEELRKLMGLPEFQDASFRLQQFAIWTITDNPARGQYVGLSTGGSGGTPTNVELQKIADWFKTAGISLESYPALR